jgi:argininosuccinate lyase
MALLTVTKGLPLCYNKDLQEDKEPLFDTVDTWIESLAVMEIVVRGLKIRPERMRAATKAGFLNATEIADYLVRKGMPFRKSHEIVGQIVVYALGEGKDLEALTLEEYQRFSALFDGDLFSAISLEAAISAKDVVGGTAPQRVLDAMARARQRLHSGSVK